MEDITNCYEEDCKGCIRSQGTEDENKLWGGIVKLNGDWILNHYMGEEGFLGWMILQPRCHRMKLADLKSNELSSLGENIQKIDIALGNYWKKYFEPLERVYVVYFFESVYAKPEPEKFHMHIHLISRPKSFDKLLREYNVSNSIESSSPNAWRIPTLTKYKDMFPEKYIKNKEKVTNLMSYLKDILS